MPTTLIRISQINLKRSNLSYLLILGVLLEENNRQVIEGSIENISFIMFLWIKTGVRENEIEELKIILKTLDQEDKIKYVDDELSN